MKRNLWHLLRRFPMYFNGIMSESRSIYLFLTLHLVTFISRFKREFQVFRVSFHFARFVFGLVIHLQWFAMFRYEKCVWIITYNFSQFIMIMLGFANCESFFSLFCFTRIYSRKKVSCPLSSDKLLSGHTTYNANVNKAIL